MVSGMATDETARAYIRGHGVAFIPRALEQHVSHIDRRGELLRDTVHRVATQCNQEGLHVEFNGNALLTANGASPFNAVHGR